MAAVRYPLHPPFRNQPSARLPERDPAAITGSAAPTLSWSRRSFARHRRWGGDGDQVLRRGEMRPVFEVIQNEDTQRSGPATGFHLPAPFSFLPPPFLPVLLPTHCWGPVCCLAAERRCAPGSFPEYQMERKTQGGVISRTKEMLRYRFCLRWLFEVAGERLNRILTRSQPPSHLVFL